MPSAVVPRRMLRLGRRSVAVTCAALGLLVACSGGQDAADGVSGSLFVSASGSAGAAMEEMATAFETAFDGVDVSVNIANSSALASQINAGAPVDVFASADETNMQTVEDGIGTMGDPVVFATNEPQILVASGNPFGVSELADLEHLDLVYVAVAPEASIGRYVSEIVGRTGVMLSPASFEQTPTAAATKVILGEADATIVFATDVIAAGDRGEGVVIAPEVNVTATNLIAIPAEAPNPAAAEAFVEFVLGETGQAILASYGFGSP